MFGQACGLVVPDSAPSGSEQDPALGASELVVEGRAVDVVEEVETPDQVRGDRG
jgi:hypothetical protein